MPFNIVTNRDALAKLKQLSTRLEEVEYAEIMGTLKNSIRKIPIPIARLQENTAIDRVRKNRGEKLFARLHYELSYIKDRGVIENCLTEFGRANEPHQPMFYAAIESTLLGHPRITALAETSDLFQNPDGVNFTGELYTVSRWRNKEQLFLAEMVFSQDAITTNPDVKRAYEKQVDFAKGAGIDVDFYLDFLIFVSDQFARPKKTHHDYKISTAYTNLILTNPKIHGVAYPSVQTKYHGQNVVFPPGIVDKYLVVEALSVQRLYKNKMKSYLNNFKNFKNPNDCHENILWVDLDPKYVATEQEILDSLES